LLREGVTLSQAFQIPFKTATLLTLKPPNRPDSHPSQKQKYDLLYISQPCKI
jgi:hypothetical protein